MTAPRIERLALQAIKLDPRCQIRGQEDGHTVDDYADAMLAGATFPPLVVFFDGETYWLADGFHRWWAASAVAGSAPAGSALSRKELDAEVHEGGLREAILFACRANAAHGLPRTKGTKQRAVDTLLEDEEWSAWSDREIARRCLVSHTFVANRRSVLSRSSGNVASHDRRYTTKHGTEAVMSTPNIGRGVTGNVASDGNEVRSLPTAPAVVAVTGNVASDGNEVRSLPTAPAVVAAVPVDHFKAVHDACGALQNALTRAYACSPETSGSIAGDLERLIPVLEAAARKHIARYETAAEDVA